MANRLMKLLDYIPRTDMPLSSNGNGKHRPVAGETKALSMSYPAELFFDIADKYLPRDAHAVSSHSAYGLIPLLYSVMKFRATKIVEPPLWIAEEKDGQEEWVEDHDLSEVLERPNEDMEMADLLEATHTLMDEGGRCLWVKTRDKAGRVARLYPFGAHEFSVEATDDRLYGRFRVSGNRNRLRDFPPEDVVLFRHDWKETSPVNVVLGHLNIGQALRDAIRSQLRRAISPSTTIEFDTPLDQENRDRFKAELTAQFAGAFNTGRPMVLEGAKLNQLSFGLKDLALGPVQSDIEVAVGEAFQMHPALFGARIGVENSGSWADTIASAQDLFYDLYAFPTWARIEKTLTRSLLREVDDNPLRFIRFDKSKVRALQVDQGKRITEANTGANFLSVDERRVYAGWDALEEDDDRGDQIGAAAADPFGGLFGKGRRGVPERKSGERRLSTLPTKGRVIIGKDQPAMEQRQLLWKEFDQDARALEGAHEEAALGLFNAEAADVAAVFAAPDKDTETDRFIEAALRKIAESYRPGGEYHRRWLEQYLRLIAETFEVGAEGVSAATGVDFNLQNPRVIAAIAARANRLAGNVSATTYEAIQAVVTAGRRDGLGIRQIADAIQENVFGGEISEVRAIRIARTETIGALNAGEHTAAIESGVIRSKSWLTQGDGRVRESHAAIDGSRVAIDAQFANGLEYPGDQAGDAADVIQCRCTLLYHDQEAA